MPKKVTGYYRDPASGETSAQSMLAVHLNAAIEAHPDQWSRTSWKNIKPAAEHNDDEVPFKVVRKGGLNMWAVFDGETLLFGPVKNKLEADRAREKLAAERRRASATL